LHHHSSSNGVEGVGGKSRDGGNDLGEEEFKNNGGVSFIFEKECFSRVISSEIASSISDDTSDRNTKSLIKS